MENKKFNDAEMSCGIALVKEFKNLGKFQCESQKAEYISFIKEIFEKYNTPKEYAKEMLEALNKMSVRRGQAYIGNVVLAGYNMRATLNGKDE